MNVLISIVMPVFNAGDFIEQTFKSLLNQSFRDFELIVVDDGSTDESINIANKFASKDNRIKLLKNTGKGAATARNLGIREASGKFISFVDADDLYKKEMFSSMYSKAVSTNADITVCGYRKFDNSSGKTLWEFKPLGKFLIHERIKSRDHLSDLFSVVPPSPWGKLIKRDLINKNNILFQELSSCNDFAFTYTALSKARVISFCPEVLLYYRANTGKNISSNRGSKAINILEAIKRLKDNMEKLGNFKDMKLTFLVRSKQSLQFELSNCSEEEKKAFYSYARSNLDNNLARDLELL